MEETCCLNGFLVVELLNIPDLPSVLLFNSSIVEREKRNDDSDKENKSSTSKETKVCRFPVLLTSQVVCTTLFTVDAFKTCNWKLCHHTCFLKVLVIVLVNTKEFSTLFFYINYVYCYIVIRQTSFATQWTSENPLHFTFTSSVLYFLNFRIHPEWLFSVASLVGLNLLISRSTQQWIWESTLKFSIDCTNCNEREWDLRSYSSTLHISS